ncbi:RNA polymerase sigma factor SigJ [Virgisporangium ochraceum]|uniref:RNA polymerase sigma factor SigJ n=1 Tax=Virgisporangium ochraceum TaxID=65505 RepID=A0A8J4A2E2_9ACTN|nr:RNA polymerase sigma factor SigJ [Virgisporangium ochraceum]
MTDEFEEHRAHLVGVAYRMLGSRAEAEDAVQEAYLRFAGVDRSEIRDLRGWLTTTTGRICLDVLRSARVRREAYVGPWLPEPIVERLPTTGVPSPEDVAVRADEVTYALLVVLERLTPEQRVAFVLHDVFGVPFDEIAAALKVTGAAARQLATRARRAVADDRVRHTATPAEQRQVAEAFLAAVGGGDLDALVKLLAPDVIAVGDGGGVVPAGRRAVEGTDKVARFLFGIFEKTLRSGGPVRAEQVLVNGSLGFLLEFGEPPQRLVTSLAIADGRITGIFDQLNPAKLTAVPRVDPSRDLFGRP